MKHHNFFKLKFLQPEFTRITFGLLYILTENLNSKHQKLCEFLNRATGPCSQRNGINFCARGLQRANLDSVVVE